MPPPIAQLQAGPEYHEQFMETPEWPLHLPNMGGLFIWVLLATWHMPASTPPAEDTDSHIESPV